VSPITIILQDYIRLSKSEPPSGAVSFICRSVCVLSIRLPRSRRVFLPLSRTATFISTTLSSCPHHAFHITELPSPTRVQKRHSASCLGSAAARLLPSDYQWRLCRSQTIRNSHSRAGGRPSVRILRQMSEHTRCRCHVSLRDFQAYLAVAHNLTEHTRGKMWFATYPNCSHLRRGV